MSQEKNSFALSFFDQIFEILATLFMMGGLYLLLVYPEIIFAVIKVMGVLAPMALFIALYGLLTAKKYVTKRKKKKKEEEEGIEADYEFFQTEIIPADEARNDLLAFGTAVFIIVLSDYLDDGFNKTDIFQAISAIVAIYLTKKIYLKKHFNLFGRKY